MLQIGSIVYFKRARQSLLKKYREGEFKGHGFGLFLGHVPPGAGDPPNVLVRRCMGENGWLTFDDITDALGTEATATVVKHFKKKYWGVDEDAPEKLEPAQNEGSPPEEPKPAA